MSFTSPQFPLFLLIVFGAYWALPSRRARNLLLLVASYVFYGFIHPWLCSLLAISTVVDYYCALAIRRYPSRRLGFLVASLTANLSLLVVFKAVDFFIGPAQDLFASIGLALPDIVARVGIPAGISFYAFQTMSYTIDVYRGEAEPRRNFLDFALYVSFFPQLVSGPIERSTTLLPQLETRHRFDLAKIATAFPLLITAYFKKFVVADNLGWYVDKIFQLENPSLTLMAIGGQFFVIQLFADFSAYTDIARAIARMFGVELMRNFNRPLIAISPSDFWRRWNISLSTWVRDYLYIPLGGSRVNSRLAYAGIVISTMALMGLWHGIGPRFLTWGIMHGVYLFVYHTAGIGGRWRPKTVLGTLAAWAVMTALLIPTWFLFRAESFEWIVHALTASPLAVVRPEDGAALVVISTMTLLYSAPLLLLYGLEWFEDRPWAPYVKPVLYGACAVGILLFRNEVAYDFIYFQF